MTLIGTTGSYSEIQGLETEYGRFIQNADLDNHTYIVILTHDTAIELLGRADVVGEKISLNGQSFLITGVLSEDSTSSLTNGSKFMSSSLDDSSDSSVLLEGYIPFSTMTRIADNVLDVTQFYGSAVSEESLDPAKNALTELLLECFQNDEDAFSVTDQSEIMDTMENVNSTMSLMIGGIAAISLLVGGIGIMNIMLVSVTERTREIGIRKAIGAKKKCDHAPVSSGSSHGKHYGMYGGHSSVFWHSEDCRNVCDLHEISDKYKSCVDFCSIFRYYRDYVRFISGK